MLAAQAAILNHGAGAGPAGQTGLSPWWRGSTDLDFEALIEFIETVLQAGERGQIGGLDIREVRAGTVAFHETKVSELEAAALAALIQFLKNLALSPDDPYD